MRPFRDRSAAGRELGHLLIASGPPEPDAVVLGLPRGGVPVAAAVAAEIGAVLDIVVVRKLGTPGNRELAMGAIGSGGGIVIDRDLIAALGIPPTDVDAVIARETAELERRERVYRGGRTPVEVAGRPVVIVDDGIATGSTMEVAVRTVASRSPASITVAVPVAPPGAATRFRSITDRVVVAREPTPFIAVGAWYDDFTQTTDDEVRRLLER